MRFIVEFADDVDFKEVYETITEMQKALIDKSFQVRDIKIEAI